jgi:hypothetical protein
MELCGLPQRNAALDRIPGPAPIYFAKKDNVYSLDLFYQLLMNFLSFTPKDAIILTILHIFV